MMVSGARPPLPKTNPKEQTVWKGHLSPLLLHRSCKTRLRRTRGLRSTGPPARWTWTSSGARTTPPPTSRTANARSTSSSSTRKRRRGIQSCQSSSFLFHYRAPRLQWDRLQWQFCQFPNHPFIKPICLQWQISAYRDKYLLTVTLLLQILFQKPGFCQHFELFQLDILAMLSRQAEKVCWGLVSQEISIITNPMLLNASHWEKCGNGNVGYSDTFAWYLQCHCKRRGLFNLLALLSKFRVKCEPAHRNSEQPPSR